MLEKRRFRQRSDSSRGLTVVWDILLPASLLSALTIYETCREAGVRKRKNRF